MCNKKEFLLLFLLAIVCVFLETNTYGASLPWYIWVLPMMLSWINKKVALFFLVASQLFSLNLDAPLNSTIMFTLIYGFSIIRKISYRSLYDCFMASKPIWIFIGLVCLRDLCYLAFDDITEMIKMTMIVVVCYYIVSSFKSIHETYEPLIFASLSGAMGFFLHKYFGYSFIINSSHISSAFEAERGGFVRFMIGNGDYNFYGAFIVVGFAVALAVLVFFEIEKWKKIFFLFSLLFFIPALLSTVSRGAIINMVATVAVCFFMFFKHKALSLKKMIGIFCSFAVVGFFLLPLISKYISAIISFQRDTGDNSRSELAGMYFDYINEYLLFGINGLDLGIKMAAHNTFIETLANYGIIVFAFFINLISTTFRRRNLFDNDFLPLQIALMTIMISFLSLSMLGFKVFWVILFIILYYEKKNSLVFKSNRR